MISGRTNVNYKVLLTQRNVNELRYDQRTLVSNAELTSFPMSDAVNITNIVQVQAMVFAERNLLYEHIHFAKEIQLLRLLASLLIANSQVVVLVTAPYENFLRGKSEDMSDLRKKIKTIWRLHELDFFWHIADAVVKSMSMIFVRYV